METLLQSKSIERFCIYTSNITDKTVEMLLKRSDVTLVTLQWCPQVDMDAAFDKLHKKFPNAFLCIGPHWYSSVDEDSDSDKEDSAAPPPESE